jgi:hypothetical protein
MAPMGGDEPPLEGLALLMSALAMTVALTAYDDVDWSARRQERKTRMVSARARTVCFSGGVVLAPLAWAVDAPFGRGSSRWR